MFFNAFMALEMDNLQCRKFLPQTFGKPRGRVPKVERMVHNHQQLHGCKDLITERNRRNKSRAKKFESTRSSI